MRTEYLILNHLHTEHLTEGSLHMTWKQNTSQGDTCLAPQNRELLINVIEVFITFKLLLQRQSWKRSNNGDVGGILCCLSPSIIKCTIRNIKMYMPQFYLLHNTLCYRVVLECFFCSTMWWHVWVYRQNNTLHVMIFLVVLLEVFCFQVPKTVTFVISRGTNNSTVGTTVECYTCI